MLCACPNLNCFIRFSMFRNTTPDSSDLWTLNLRPKYFLYISYIFVLDNMIFFLNLWYSVIPRGAGIIFRNDTGLSRAVVRVLRVSVDKRLALRYINFSIEFTFSDNLVNHFLLISFDLCLSLNILALSVI